MVTLTSVFGNAGNALDVLQSALSIVQANVSNASTPGYATQEVHLEATPVDVVSGSGGGVTNGGVSTTRDPYADSTVARQLQNLGLYKSQATAMTSLQGFFDVTGATGIASSLSALFSSFSGWSASPTDPAQQQGVINAASTLSANINSLSTTLKHASSQIGQQVTSTVAEINSLASQICQYNASRENYGQSDPGSDAQLQNNLESLANLVNFTAIPQSDGTVTVLVGNGTTPLVMGQQQFSLSAAQSVLNVPPAANPQSPPTSQVLDSQGNDITADLTSGQLGGLLDTRNRVLAGIIGDAQHSGSLNTFAKTFADTVNNILTSGTVSTALAALAGAPLFTYSAADSTLSAGTLQVAAGYTVNQLAPVDAAGNANGNSTLLANLASASASIAGQSFTDYYGSIAAGVGTETQIAQSNQQAQQSVVTQAQSLRDSISGVSINAQAALLLQFQHSYQAMSQVLNVINQIASDLMQVVHN